MLSIFRKYNTEFLKITKNSLKITKFLNVCKINNMFLIIHNIYKYKLEKNPKNEGKGKQNTKMNLHIYWN